MKANIKFFVVVLSILLASSAILVGCMYAIASDKGEPKENNKTSETESNAEAINGSVFDGDENEDYESVINMQKKFDAMNKISEDGKSITVITEEYLDKYWQTGGNAVRSLTTQEVYFIIQDSIRIYSEYDEVVLPNFDEIVLERFKFHPNLLNYYQNVKDDRLDKTKATDLYYGDEMNIHAIIMYRLQALSSREAFISAAEAIEFAGGDPWTYNGLYPESVFYIPDYPPDLDRNQVLSILGGAAIGKPTVEEPPGINLFTLSDQGGITIYFSSAKNGNTTEVFPKMESEEVGNGYDAPESMKDMQKKFDAMSKISKDGKSITVITEEFLEKYWQNGEDVVHSLSTQEVYFIIQDSIRLYSEYEEIILPKFHEYVIARYDFPNSFTSLLNRYQDVKNDKISTKKIGTSHYYENDINNIHAIIMYRLQALSSREAFFTAMEAIEFVGGEPDLYSQPQKELMFYIPDYSADVDRSSVLELIANDYFISIGIDQNDREKYSDLFSLSKFGGTSIEFLSFANKISNTAFPTAEMEEREANDYENAYEIKASSLQDFLDKFSKERLLQAGQRYILSKSLESGNLSFEGYQIKDIYYFANMDRDGRFGGNMAIESYWRDNEDNEDARVKISMRLVYQKSGIEGAIAAGGFSQTRTPYLYAKKTGNKTVYAYWIDAQYYCQFTIDNDVSHRDEMIGQWISFCAQLRELAQDEMFA